MVASSSCGRMIAVAEPNWKYHRRAAVMFEIAFRDDGGVIITWEGAVTGKELMDAFSEIYATDEQIKRIAYQLIVLTKSEEIMVTADELRRVAALDIRASKVNPNMLVAVVGDRDIVFGLARMWETFVDDAPLKTKVFRNREDAEDWLKLNLPQTR